MARLRCPSCCGGSPTPEDVEKVGAGEWDVKLGGGVMPEPYVNVACRACGHRWPHEESAELVEP